MRRTWQDIKRSWKFHFFFLFLFHSVVDLSQVEAYVAEAEGAKLCFGRLCFSCESFPYRATFINFGVDPFKIWILLVGHLHDFTVGTSLFRSSPRTSKTFSNGAEVHGSIKHLGIVKFICFLLAHKRLIYLCYLRFSLLGVGLAHRIFAHIQTFIYC